MISSEASGSKPKLISSQLTFLHKRLFPVIWFGVLGVTAIGGLTVPGTLRNGGPAFLVPLVLMGLLGFLFMRKVVFDLVDEVWDEGASLLVKNKGHEVRVELSEVVNIGYTRLVNPPRVTLTLRRTTPLGTEISFFPPAQFIPFVRSPVIDDLIRRVDDARRRT